jgi:small subunit ribosomal protein S2
MVDTNSDPREVEYVIPSNDDASKSIDKILSLVTAAIIDGLANRTSDKEGDAPTEAVAEVVAPVAEEVVIPATEVEVAAPVAETEAPATEE